MIAAAPISALALFVVAGERDLSPARNISSASRGETQLHHPSFLPPPSSFFFFRVTLSTKLSPLPYLAFPLCLSPYPLSFRRKHQPSPGMIRLAISTVYRPPFDRGIGSSPPFSLPSFSLFSHSFISASPPTPRPIPTLPPHVSCHLLPIVSVVFSGGEIRQL